MEITAPKEWFLLLDVLKEEKGIVILLGATDTGKSTLAKFLILNLCQQGLKVALVDADVGQSTLGPPATIGLSVFKSDPDWEVVLSPPEIFFVGSTTPEGHFPLHLKGVKRMVDKAISYGTELILVDTTGFVSGEAGKELKRRKIDLLSPRFILALQKSDELEPILALYKENPLYKIYRLPLSEQVSARSMEERRMNRASKESCPVRPIPAYKAGLYGLTETRQLSNSDATPAFIPVHRTGFSAYLNKFRDYFKDSVIQELAIEEVQIEGEVLDPGGEVIPLDCSLRINGLLIGLKDSNDETLALGIVKNCFEEKKVVRVSTPLRDIQRVKTIQLSSLKVIPLYEEERS